MLGLAAKGRIFIQLVLRHVHIVGQVCCSAQLLR